MSTKTYSLGKVAEDLDCTPRWLTEQVRSGRFPARKIARHWRFTEADIELIFALCANDFGKTTGTTTVSSATNVTPIATGLTPRSRKRVVG